MVYMVIMNRFKTVDLLESRVGNVSVLCESQIRAEIPYLTARGSLLFAGGFSRATAGID